MQCQTAPSLIDANLRFERETIDAARRLLDDIPPCAWADYSVRFLGGAPTLILAFHIPETQDQPALAVGLVAKSRSNPHTPGKILEGDRLRRHIRDSVEHYLHKHGVRIPVFQEG